MALKLEPELFFIDEHGEQDIQPAGSQTAAAAQKVEKKMFFKNSVSFMRIKGTEFEEVRLPFPFHLA